MLLFFGQMRETASTAEESTNKNDNDFGWLSKLSELHLDAETYIGFVLTTLTVYFGAYMYFLYRLKYKQSISNITSNVDTIF